MSLKTIKALTFDTGGTVLDWHTGFANALGKACTRHGMERDWGKLANELRRRSLAKMRGQGGTVQAGYNFDTAHREALDELIADEILPDLTKTERHEIAYMAPHTFTCWPDFPEVQKELRKQYLCASLTILSFRIVMDTARANGIAWDAIFSCEAIGTYKPDPVVYDKGAEFLQLDPSECCMVAAHNFDLNAAKARGYKTVFVRRPREWGDELAPEPVPNPEHDLIVDDFPSLLRALSDARL